MPITLKTFRDYLHRQRKKNGGQRSLDQAKAVGTASLPPGTGGATPPQQLIPQTITSQTMPEITDAMNARERRQAIADQYIPKESHPLLRRIKGA